LSEHATRQKGFTHETERPFDIRNPRSRDRGADCRFCGEYDYGAAANVHGTSTAFLAHDADSALGLIDRNDVRVDLLLADLVLPGMNGGQLAEEVKARQPEARVLFITGYSRDAINSQWPTDPDVEVLHKPLMQDALERKLHATLNQAP